MIKFLEQVLASVPARTMCVVGMDLNDGLGSGGADDTVGDKDLAEEHYAGVAMRHLMAQFDLAAINTFYGGQPTFYGHIAERTWESRIDDILIPAGARTQTTWCTTLLREGTRL